MEKLFSYSSLVHAVSGMVGGATAITVFYPLNVLRTRLQVTEQKEMEGFISLGTRLVRQEGLSALFVGWQSQVMALAASNFVYFYQYNGLKAVWKKMQQNAGQKADLSTGMNLVIATLAGVINVLTTTPFWVVSTRLAAHPSGSRGSSPSGKTYSGMIDGLVTIQREEGWMGLWNGTGPSLLLVSNPSIQFVVYERVRSWMTARASTRGSPITTFEFFVLGAIAKAVATVVTYPIQLAQSRLRAMKSKSAQSQGHSPSYEYSGTLDVLVKVFKQDGFWGLFRGCEAKLWQTVLTAAFMMVSYEKISALVFKIMLRNSSSSQQKALAL